MSTKQLQPGGEIDAYCTACKADRLHNIIALVGQTPKKVQCRSCNGSHLYRATQAQKDAAAAHKRAVAGSRPASKSKPKVSVRATAVAQRKREEDQHASWEQATTGKGPESFKPYGMTKTFAKGDLVRHTKFGDGVVASVIDANKLEAIFQDGARTLAHSMGVPA